jgi:hypothetical protein
MDVRPPAEIVRHGGDRVGPGVPGARWAVLWSRIYADLDEAREAFLDRAAA